MASPAPIRGFISPTSGSRGAARGASDMAINIDDLRRRARRRLPRAVFDFVDGGAEDETTLRANRRGFQQLTFRPRTLVDVSQRDQSTTILGQPVSSPIVIAPTGLPGLLWPRAEAALARAAAKRGII